MSKPMEIEPEEKAVVEGVEGVCGRRAVPVQPSEYHGLLSWKLRWAREHLRCRGDNESRPPGMRATPKPLQCPP